MPRKRSYGVCVVYTQYFGYSGCNWSSTVGDPMVRMQILVDDEHKALAEKFAKEADTSASEIVRRALEAYEPAHLEETAELKMLLRSLTEANKRARKALRQAEKEVAQTLEYYADSEKIKTPG